MYKEHIIRENIEEDLKNHPGFFKNIHLYPFKTAKGDSAILMISSPMRIWDFDFGNGEKNYFASDYFPDNHIAIKSTTVFMKYLGEAIEEVQNQLIDMI